MIGEKISVLERYDLTALILQELITYMSSDPTTIERSIHLIRDLAEPGARRRPYYQHLRGCHLRITDSLQVARTILKWYSR